MKPRGRPRKIDPQQDQDLELDNRTDNHEEDLPDIPPNIEAFFEAARANSDAPIRMLLYRIVQPRGAGRPKRFFLDEYRDDPPGLVEVGEKFGGGEYEIILLNEDPQPGAHRLIKTALFNIDARYDDIAKQKAAPAIMQQQQQIDPQAAISQSLQFITQILQAITPAMQRPQQENPAHMIQAISEIGSGLLQNSFKSQMEAQKEMLTTLREYSAPGMSGEADTEEDRTFDRIMQALETFAPMFLKSPEPIRAPMIAVAKKNPDVKAVLSSIEKKARFRKKLVEKYGEQQAAEIYTMFAENHRNKKAPAAPSPQPPAAK